MNKRLASLHLSQWRSHADNHRLSTEQLIAVPLLIVATVLIVDGVFSVSASSLAIGVIGLIAARAIQRHAQGLKA